MSSNSINPRHTPSSVVSSSTEDFKAPTFKENAGLILYYHPYNFYSQKVLLILYEKNIDFTPYAVDLSNGEQYSSWFLNLNPKADVPVLQHDDYIVTESNYIIDYLERKYSGANHKSLQSADIHSAEYYKMQFYESLVSKLPIGALALGSFIHDDLKLSPKPPFIGPIRKACLKNNEKVYTILKNSVDTAETNKMALLRKLDLQDRRKRLVYSRVEFQKILDAVHNVLRFIENELRENCGQEWLTGIEFTLADVSVGLLLHRLYQLGFENYFWSYGKLPNVESYFLRFKKRHSYQKLIPSSFSILKDIWQKTPNNYKIGASAGAGVIGMAMFAAFAHK